MMSLCELSVTKLPRYLLASSFRARAVQSDVTTRIFFSLCLADAPKGARLLRRDSIRPTDEFRRDENRRERRNKTRGIIKLNAVCVCMCLDILFPFLYLQRTRVLHVRCKLSILLEREINLTPIHCAITFNCLQLNRRSN